MKGINGGKWRNTEFLSKYFMASHRTGASGFTLTEVLVVVIIAGVLAAIAAPGWLAFMNRQRLGAAQTEVLQLLREAQKQSIAKRSSYGIRLSPDDASSIQKISAKGLRENGGTGDIDGAPNVITSEKIGDGEVDFDLTIETPDGTELEQLVFNFDGTINQAPIAVIVAVPDQPNVKRCVIIETLLGSMTEASSNECDGNA